MSFKRTLNVNVRIVLILILTFAFVELTHACTKKLWMMIRRSNEHVKRVEYDLKKDFM